jgi:hypothetical protein
MFDHVTIMFEQHGPVNVEEQAVSFTESRHLPSDVHTTGSYGLPKLRCNSVLDGLWAQP